MNDKWRLVYAAHEILTTQQGATALPTVGEVVQTSKCSGNRAWHDWAITMSVCGDLAGGWDWLVDAYLSDERFTRAEQYLSRTFWRIVRKRKGLYGTGIHIAEMMGVE